jgi:multidrug efflux pump subunit AcrB
MSGIISFWARNSVAANLLMVICFIGGIFGYSSLENEIFPQGEFNGATVSMAWQGASPQDIEDQIVIRIEEALTGLDGLERITSTSREGSGSVNVQAKASTDIDRFMDEVEARVDSINNFPPAAFEPQVRRWRNQSQYVGFALYGPVDPVTMKRRADEIRDELALIDGGELAEVVSTLPEEVSIEVSEETLRRYNLTFDEISGAIQRASINASGGSVRTETGQSQIEVRQRADTAEEFGNIIIRQTSDGATVRVKDVATVRDGFVDVQLRATYNGYETAFIMVNAPEEMHVTEYFKAMDEYVEEFNARDNEPLTITVLFSEADFYNRLTGTIEGSALLGFFLVMVVLVLFLRPTVAFWVVIGVATSFAGTFAVLPFLDVSLNILTLFAILLVIGILVDDAIIVGENIHRQVEMGHREGVDAAIIGSQLVVKPVIFGVVTTMIMFAPWALLEGGFRQFTQQLTLVVVAALTFSIIEAFLILPAHLSHLKHEQPRGALAKVQHAIAESLLWFSRHVYGAILRAALKFRYVTAAVFLVLFWWALTLVSSGIVPFRAQPDIEQDIIQARVEMPDGSPFSRALEVEEQFLEGVDRARERMSELYPGYDEEFIQDVSLITDEGGLQSWISLMSPENRPEGLRTQEFGRIIREEMGPVPDAEEVSFQFTFNDSGNAVQFALNAEDLDLLQTAAEDLKRHLATYDSTYDIGDNLSAPAQAIRLSLKPGAEALGVDLATVSNQVRQAYFGELVQRIQRDGEEVEVRVRYPEAERRSLDSIRNFRVRLPSGEAVPIQQVAEVTFAPGIERINRRERTRSVTVRAQLNGEVRGEIIDDMNRPGGYWDEFKERFPEVSNEPIGGAQDESDFLMNIAWLNLGAIGIMYFLLAIAFRSYAQPVLLLMAIPFAFAGAAFGHLAFGVTMAMFSLFGIAAGAGVVINDNLVLLDALNRRRREGSGALQATIDACITRFRPIILTSVTTFVGILPMIAERSIDAQFLKPMVLSLGCAVGFALFVSLLFVPALYLIGVEIGRFFKWAWGGRPYRRVGETYIDDAHAGTGSALPSPSPAPAE